MTFSENILNLSDANGTISWSFAWALANLHSISTADFLGEYAGLKGERVDAGELLVWLGY
jgi:hypothetical protein